MGEKEGKTHKQSQSMGKMTEVKIIESVNFHDRQIWPKRTTHKHEIRYSAVDKTPNITSFQGTEFNQ